MARKPKRKPKSRAKTKSKPARRTAAKARPKKRGGVTKTGAKKRAGGKSTEVEKNWQSYWQCRTELEVAVAEVRDAEQSLASARERERTCRAVFDRTKDTLKKLLEVEPASSSAARAVLDFKTEPVRGPDAKTS